LMLLALRGVTRLPYTTLFRSDHVLVVQPDGRIKRGSDGGFYARDTRFVSSYELTIGGKRPQLLNACTVRFFTARHVMTNPRLVRSEEHTSELQSRGHLVCRLL